MLVLSRDLSEINFKIGAWLPLPPLPQAPPGWVAGSAQGSLHSGCGRGLFGSSSQGALSGWPFGPGLFPLLYIGTPLFPPSLGWAVPFAGGVLVSGGLRWRPPALAHPLWRRLAFFYPFLEPAPLCCVHRCGCLAAPSSAPPSTPWLGGWLGSGLRCGRGLFGPSSRGALSVWPTGPGFFPQLYIAPATQVFSRGLFS